MSNKIVEKVTVVVVVSILSTAFIVCAAGFIRHEGNSRQQERIKLQATGYARGIEKVVLDGCEYWYQRFDVPLVHKANCTNHTEKP